MAGLLLLAGAAWVLRPHPAPAPPPAVHAPPSASTTAPAVTPPLPPPREFAVQTATEEQIRANNADRLSIFRFAANARILVLDFPSLHQQALMLNRVAALVEKRGLPRDRLLTDAELEAAIRDAGETADTYYYGHDYSATDLARFFRLADRDRIPLNAEEEMLRRLLRQEGWLEPQALGGLISIPRAGADERITASVRAVILRHELSHGEFFSNPAYAAYVRRFWQTTLTEAERDGVRRFLQGEDYDISLPELVVNEMQAYLMFTHDPGFFSPSRIGMTAQRLAELQAAFAQGVPAGWLRERLPEPAVIPAAAPGR